MAKRKRLVLFDVDYTLIRGSKIHKASIVEGIKEIFGIQAPIDRLKLHGMTDQQIVTDLLKISGIEDSTIKEKMDLCIKSITQFYNLHRSDDNVHLMEGVKSLLKELSKHEDVILGLVTGNIEQIAYGKLSSVSISEHFTLGGFGSDHIERYRLVEIAIERAKKKYNIKKLNTFIVGDTPKDIIAAKKAGVYSIGVATGSFDKQELKKAGADFVLESLSEKEKFINFINSK